MHRRTGLTKENKITKTKTQMKNTTENSTGLRTMKAASQFWRSNKRADYAMSVKLGC